MADIDPKYPSEYGSDLRIDTERDEPEPDEDSEYDETASLEDGEAVSDSEAEESGQEEPEQETPPRKAAAQAFQAPAGVPEQIANDISELQQLLGEEGFQRQMRVMEFMLSQREQASAYANYQVYQDAQQHPDWHREYGGSLNRVLGQLKPDARVTQQGLEAARMMVIHEEAQSTDDWPGTLRRHAAMLEGKKPAAKPQVLPQKERVPSGGSVPTTRSGAGPRATGKSSVENRIAARWGKSNAAALLDED